MIPGQPSGESGTALKGNLEFHLERHTFTQTEILPTEQSRQGDHTILCSNKTSHSTTAQLDEGILHITLAINSTPMTETALTMR